MKIIELSQNQIALVDDEDFERVNQFKWCACWNKHTKSFYAQRTDRSGYKQKLIGMHRFIMNVTDSKTHIDHKSHNTLDNQKENLRLCTNSQNHMNQKVQEHSSIYKGVGLHKLSNKWQSRITINK